MQHIRYHLADCLLAQNRELREALTLLAHLQPTVLDNAEQTADWPGRLAYEKGRALLQLHQPAQALAQLREAERIVAGQPEGDEMVSFAAVRKLREDAQSVASELTADQVT